MRHCSHLPYLVLKKYHKEVKTIKNLGGKVNHILLVFKLLLATLEKRKMVNKHTHIESEKAQLPFESKVRRDRAHLSTWCFPPTPQRSEMKYLLPFCFCKHSWKVFKMPSSILVFCENANMSLLTSELFQ